MAATRLENKVALITGGNSGIGLATTKAFVQEGAKVYITGRDEKRLSAVTTELGDRVVAIRADSGVLSDIERTIATIRDQGDRLDVIFYNAGIAPFAPLDQVDEAFFDRVFTINTKGAYFTIHRALPILNDGASIFFNGTALVYRGMVGSSVYSASKAALNSLAKTLAAELAERQIRVNVLNPGPIETPIYSKLGMPAAELEQMSQQIVGAVPLKRFGAADEIARAALFLASSDSSYMTGSAIDVDGGFGQV